MKGNKQVAQSQHKMLAFTGKIDKPVGKVASVGPKKSGGSVKPGGAASAGGDNTTKIPKTESTKGPKFLDQNAKSAGIPKKNGGPIPTKQLKGGGKAC